MSKHKSLTASKKSKQDEFYTQLTDIEKELVHYKEHFKDKVVFCNCDDPEHSNFWWYFKLNFDFLGLKKLITTHYDEGNPTYKLIIDGTKRNKDGNPIERKFNLKGNGDFRNPESIEILKESDIVVTNPPFSLFSEYVEQLMQYGKKFLIIGNLNATTYKGIFKYIQNNEMWWGVSRNGSGSMWFVVPDDAPDKSGQKIDADGRRYQTIGSTVWFTNLPHDKRYEDIILIRKYEDNEEKYPEYENYKAIEVSKVVDIPEDYEGAMGVPITFIGKYNPEQFEIIWTTDRGGDGYLDEIKKPHTRFDAPVVDGAGKYKRIIIKHKRGGQ